jgi:hypothetical protein
MRTLDDRRCAPRSWRVARDARAAWSGDRRPDLRVTDVARERAASVLNQALVEGSLTVEETEQRLTTAYAARHERELSAVLADLPQHRTTSPGSRVAFARRLAHNRSPLLLLAVAAIVAIALALASRGAHAAWPLWPLALVCLRASWWRRGQARSRSQSADR